MLFILLLSFLLCSQSLDDALKFYQKEEFEKSLKILDILYNKNPEDQNTKNLYIKVLTEAGMDKSLKEDYTGALLYFERAKEISPADALINDLYQTTKDIIKSSAPPKKERKKLKSKKRKKIPTVVKAIEIRRLLDIFLKLQQQQNKFLEEFSKQNQNLKTIISENLNKNNILKGEMELNRKTISNIVYINVIAILVAIFGVGTLLYLIFKNIALRKEAVLLRYQERLLEAFEKRKNLTEAEKIPIKEFREKNSPPATKLKGIEVIEAELKEDKTIEKNIAKKLLKNFINDPSLKIKEKAIRTLFKYDKEEAISIIKELSKTNSKDNILLILNLNDLIDDKHLLMLLKNYIENTDEEIKSKSIKIIEGRFSEEEIPEEIKSKIQSIKEKEGWITK